MREANKSVRRKETVELSGSGSGWEWGLGALAGCLWLAKVRSAREGGCAPGAQGAEATSPAWRFPHIWVVAAGLTCPRKQLRAPCFLALQSSLGTLYLEAASPGGPLRSSLGRPEVKLS